MIHLDAPEYTWRRNPPRNPTSLEIKYLAAIIQSRSVNEENIQKTDGTHVFLVLWKTYRALLGRADLSKKRLGLCDSDFRVLEALLHKGPLPVNVIGQKVELTTGSITSAIDRLEQKSFVARKLHPDDRRIRIVELTPKGRRFIEKVYEQHKIHMEEAVQGLSREERAILVDLLKRIGKASEAGKASEKGLARP